MAAPNREPVTVTADGITVRKTLDLEDFEAMAIVYEVTSNRDDDTRFHIEDEVPAGISAEDIGFHPGHEAAESSISADSVTFDDRLVPGEDSRIILGINNYPEDDLEVFTAEPTVELLETEASASGSISTGEAPELGSAGEQMSSGGVVRVLAKELRRDGVDEQASRLLRDELRDTEAAFENQLSELEERIDDFEVYQPPIEEFLSEYGPAERVLSTFRDEVSDIEKAMRMMQDRPDEIVGGLDTVHTRIESFGDDLERVDARMETLEESFKKTRGDFDEIDGRIEDSERQADQVSAGVRALEQRTGVLEGNVADLKEELESIREGIHRDIRSIEADLDAFDSFRNRLSAALGGEAGSFDIESDDG